MFKYFEKRQKTYPQNVKGKFRRIKNFTNLICLGIFFLFPFIRWDRGPSISNQAILIDIPDARGYFFFIEMWPEEVFYLAAILIFAAVALFFVTSLFGRVWCGYSCPQTVWTDIFIKIERYFQGDRNDRIKLDRKTFSFKNIWRKAATHIVWLLISLVTGIGFVNYFNDAPDLMSKLFTTNLGWSIWGWILGIAGMTYVMAGFAREQVCNYMCPYARFQGAMFDAETLIISYDEKRGEPRAKAKKGELFENRGHCIDCKQCVVVCPANIDIRNGLQMECIACGLCIDACDNVMEKMNLPTGLIKYGTESDDSPLQSQKIVKKSKIWRARTFFYLVILIIIGGFILFSLGSKSTLKIDVMANRNPMFVTLSNGDIRNGYTLKISNKSFEDKIYRLEIRGIKNLKVKVSDMTNINANNLPVKAGEVASFKVYARASNEFMENSNRRINIKFAVINSKTAQEVIHEAVFIGE
ncbi:MAG: cytochrome c oxidase accessory protein FixG [Lentimonas sp.]|jgi:cytochrome c oxidase accessory protein FixG